MCSRALDAMTETKGFFSSHLSLAFSRPCGTQRQTPRPLAPITPHHALSLFPAICLLWQQLLAFGRQRLFCGAVESPEVSLLTFESTVHRSILPVRFLRTMTCPPFVTCAINYLISTQSEFWQSGPRRIRTVY
jgi:hypothetical protein